jgi:excisionase family DNA binding protein
MLQTLEDFPDSYLLKVSEAADCLRVGRDLVYELVARGELPAIRLGRKIRLPVFGLKHWIKQKTGLSMPTPAGLSSLRQEH